MDIDTFYELASFEMDLRNERAMNSCIKVANFFYIKTFEDFSFSYQPSINKDEIIDFKNLRFMIKNILLIGTPGASKTHLATSIGIEAEKNRNGTYFIFSFLTGRLYDLDDKLVYTVCISALLNELILQFHKTM